MIGTRVRCGRWRRRACLRSRSPCWRRRTCRWRRAGARGERLAGLPAARRPTAAFCANDLLALGLLQSMTQQGLNVPDDLAVVGYDDIEFAAAAAVPLTSVRQPREQLGRTAAQLLLEEHDPDHEHRQVKFQPELVVRASTRTRRA